MAALATTCKKLDKIDYIPKVWSAVSVDMVRNGISGIDLW